MKIFSVILAGLLLWSLPVSASVMHDNNGPLDGFARMNRKRAKGKRHKKGKKVKPAHWGKAKRH